MVYSKVKMLSKIKMNCNILVACDPSLFINGSESSSVRLPTGNTGNFRLIRRASSDLSDFLIPSSLEPWTSHTSKFKFP
jgi:hypothetical protein